MRHASKRHITYVDGKTVLVQCDDGMLRLDFTDANEPGLWKLNTTTQPPSLQWLGPCSAAPDATESLAAMEVAFQLHPEAGELRLSLPQLPAGLSDGIVDLRPGQPPRVARSVLWQQQRLWLPQLRPPYAQHYTMTGERRHPVRAENPQNTVYRRFIPWLGRTLSLRTVDLEGDLPTIHRWMNDPTVARFWEESGDLGHHREYLERIASDPHVVGLIGCFDGHPFGYFEAYWAKEDRIAPFYDASDHDRGWHALVGEAEFRGQPYLTAWLPSLSHYLFLDDCRTQRIVVEPRSDNWKMRKSLPRCGYALLKEFDFPHKRAVLGILLRERFFADALWIPQSEAAAPDASTQ